MFDFQRVPPEVQRELSNHPSRLHVASTVSDVSALEKGGWKEIQRLLNLCLETCDEVAVAG